MTFNAEERIDIEKIFQLEVYDENLDSNLPVDVYKFLKKNNSLRTITDKIIWRKPNYLNPFEGCIITKFLHEKVNILDIFEKLLHSLEFEYLLFCDFHFMVTCPSRDTDESDFVDEIDDSTRVFKFQRASKASSFNAEIKFSSKRDTQSFLQSFSNFGPSDFLKTAFNHHSQLFGFHGSDLRPHMLLSLVLHITKIN